MEKKLYLHCLGVVAMLAATSEENYTAEGPEAIIQDLRTTFGLVIAILLTVGMILLYIFHLSMLIDPRFILLQFFRSFLHSI